MFNNSIVKSYWIHLLIDGEDGVFSTLFSKANSLGLKKLWLYIGSKGDDYCDNGEI